MTIISRSSLRFLRFLVVGGINTLFGYGAFAALIYLGVHYAVASLVATVAGVLFNFQTTGRLVFANADPDKLLRFIGVYAILYCIGLAGLRAGEVLGYSAYLTGAVLLLPNAMLSYLLNKRLVFQPKD